MRTLHAAGFAAVLAATALVAPGGASATSPTTYAGEFGGPIGFNSCTEGTPPTPGVADGTWSVRVYGDTAKGKFAISIDGVKHVFYPYPGMTVDYADENGFSVSGDTPAGLLTVTLDGPTLTYTVGNGSAGSYTFGDLVCASVVYHGTAD